MTELEKFTKAKQSRMRRKKYLKDPANRKRDQERSRQRYAEKKRRKADLEFILGRKMTINEFHKLEAKAENESV